MVPREHVEPGNLLGALNAAAGVPWYAGALERQIGPVLPLAQPIINFGGGVDL